MSQFYNDSNDYNCRQCGKKLSFNEDTGMYECLSCTFIAMENDNKTVGESPVDANFQTPEMQEYTRLLKIKEFYTNLDNATEKVYVTKILVVLNLIVFAIMLFTGEFRGQGDMPFFKWGANRGLLTVEGEWFRLFTSMFIHGGYLHIAFNMYALWSIGQMVEKLYGKVGMLVIYIFSGLVGSLSSIFYNPAVNSVGASGAVFGVFGAILGFMLYRKECVPREISSSVTQNAVFILLINGAIGMSVDRIDNAAHIGGFIGGVLAGIFLSQDLRHITSQIRLKKNLLGTVAGTLIVLGFGYQVKQKASGFNDDHKQEIEAYSSMEKKTTQTFNQLIKQARAGKITREQLAEAVEQDVLGPLVAANKKLAKYVDTKEKIMSPQYIDYLRKYMELHEKYWKAKIQYFRNNDPKADERAKKIEKEIDVLNKSMQSE